MGSASSSAPTSPEISPALIDFSALSLLPPWCRLVAAARWPNEPEAIAAIRAKARAACERAQAAALTPIAWSDARYPAALAAIVDPPPLVWTRGDPDAWRA